MSTNDLDQRFEHLKESIRRGQKLSAEQAIIENLKSKGLGVDIGHKTSQGKEILIGNIVELDRSKIYVSPSGETMMRFDGTSWQIYYREDILQQQISHVNPGFKHDAAAAENKAYNAPDSKTPSENQL